MANLVYNQGKAAVLSILTFAHLPMCIAFPQTSFGVRPSRIHFSPTELRGGEMNA